MINDYDEISWAYLLDPTFQFENTAGKPLTDGWIEVYIHGTRSKYYCASDFSGTLHPFKIPLDSLGSNIVLASPAHAYDIYVYNKYGSLIMSRYNIVPTTGDGTVIKDVVNITSKDNTINVQSNDQTNWDLSIKDTVDKVDKNTQDISSIQEDVSGLDNKITEINTSIQNIDGQIQNINTSLENKKDKQNELNFNGSATKTVKKITQYPNGEMNVEFEDIDLPQEVPNVEITSEDKSIKVSETTDVQTNTKKFDLSVNIEDAPTFGRFVANNGLTLTKTEGNMTLSSDGKIQLKKGKGYHFTIRGNYYNDTLYNDLRDISFIEYSRNETIPIIVDGTLSTSQAQPFEISFDVAQRTSDLNYGIAFSGLTSNGHISGLCVEVHDINSVSVNGGSVTSYTAGDAIEITNDTISVKYGKGLKVNVSNQLEVNAGKGLAFDNNTLQFDGELIIGKGIYYTTDGKLTTVEPESNFIDITDEWQFLNNFRLQYNGEVPGYGNEMKILYSPVSDTVKFTSSCRINKALVIDDGWNIMLQYKGDRFYTTYNAPNVDLAPSIGVNAALSGMQYVIGTDFNGNSNQSLLKLAYVGSPINQEKDSGLAINKFLYNNNPSIYGCILQNLIMRVHKKV